MKQVKLSLYLNLALCWTKLENMDQVFKCAKDALELDPTNPKALFRRAYVYESRKGEESGQLFSNLTVTACVFPLRQTTRLPRPICCKPRNTRRAPRTKESHSFSSA